MVFLIFFLCILPLSPVFAVSADYAPPQVVIKPIMLNPGHPITVSVYNGGHDIWTDVVLCIRPLVVDMQSESFCTVYPDVLPPESFTEISFNLPLSFFLSADSFEVSLFYDDRLLNSRVLPSHLVMPSAGVFADDDLYVFFDPSQFSESVTRLSVELSVLDDQDNLVFIDIFGPFYIEGEEMLLETFALPDYLPLGELTLQSRFFSDGSLLKESIVSFENRTASSSLPLNAIFLMFLVLVFLALVYLSLDMLYHRHDFEDAVKRLRK